jgi:hypothetical protein
MSQVENAQAFRFTTQLTLTELTGRSARDLLDLLRHLKAVPFSVIYYHTHHFIERHHHFSPSPPNDFAFWVSQSLQECALGERLAAIDTVQFTTLRSLRDALVATIEGHLATAAALREAPDGSEFYFMNSRSVRLPTAYVAHTLGEFADALRKVSIHSLYHHVFESRLRLDKGNDFAHWLAAQGEKELAWQISLIDPYAQNLEALRAHFLKLIEARLSEAHVPA